jgi:predicted amidohydrolase
MQDLTISLIQTRVAWEDPDSNLKHFGEKIAGIKENTDLVILPEMFNTAFTMDAANNAEAMDGKTMAWIADMAKQKDATICGSLIIRDNGNYYNRLIWMRPGGSYDFYDKKHLFRMGEEHKNFTAGTRKFITEIKGWKVLPLICYDLRFPVWSKNTFQDDAYGFDLVVYVTNWPSARSLAFTSLLRARAIENMAYSAGSNRIGTDGRTYDFDGMSMVAAPDGEVVLDLGKDKDVSATVTLDPKPMLELRSRLGVGYDWDKFAF